MSVSSTFRVGLTPDQGDLTEEIIGPALREIFDPIPDLVYEIMPRSPNDIAEREIIDRYDALVVFTYWFPKESLQGLKRLKCLARWGVGYDTIDIPAATANGVAVAITPTTIRRTVSEGVLALIFALAKRLRELDLRVREGRWRDGITADGICIQGRTLGAVGVGNISGELFRLARAIGFGRLLGSDPYCSPERAAELGVELVDLETLMRESDFVSLHTPLTPETENLINAETLAWMKPTAFLINTSRGGVVDEDALFAALKSGSIAGAALDVLREEPPPRDHPLFKLDNVLLAPHSVAWVKEGLEGNSRELCTNIRSIYRGEAPPFLVNPDVLRTQAFQTRLVAWKS